jgi:DinB family protein
MPVRADPVLPPWATHVIDELNASDRSTNDLARDLTPEQLNWRPTEQAWSVGQCLEHLHKTNQVYLPPIAASLDGQSPSPVNEITPGWFGRLFIRTYIDPATQRARGRAPRKSAPLRHVDPAILDLFLRSNDAARDLVRRASAYDVNRIRFVNPFIPVIRFTVGTGLEIVWKHQRRHLLQADRVRRAPAFPLTQKERI